MALLDWAIERLTSVTGNIAVNARHLADQIELHVSGRAFVSQEPEMLGTAGAIGFLREWIRGQAVAVTNADSVVWPNPFPALVDGWDGTTVRLAVVDSGEASADFDDGRRFAGCSLLPAEVAAGLPAAPGGLWEASWRGLLGTDRLQLCDVGCRLFDCGTPAELAAARRFLTGFPFVPANTSAETNA